MITMNDPDAHERTRYESVAPERLSEEIEHDSPEGRPGDPEVGPRRMAWMLALYLVLGVSISVAVALLIDPIAGIGVAALGLLFCCLNPAVWGSLIRAREREVAKRHLTGEDYGMSEFGSPRR